MREPLTCPALLPADPPSGLLRALESAILEGERALLGEQAAARALGAARDRLSLAGTAESAARRALDLWARALGLSPADLYGAAREAEIGALSRLQEEGIDGGT